MLGNFNHTDWRAQQIKKKGGGERGTFYPVLIEGTQKVSDLRYSHFVAPPPSPLLMTTPLNEAGADTGSQRGKGVSGNW